MLTYFKKSRHPDRKGGGVNPYGQTDRTKTMFFSAKEILENINIDIAKGIWEILISLRKF